MATIDDEILQGAEEDVQEVAYILNYLPQEVKDVDLKKSKDFTSRSQNILPLEVKELDPNNNECKEPEMNNISYPSISFSPEDEGDFGVQKDIDMIDAERFCVNLGLSAFEKEGAFGEDYAYALLTYANWLQTDQFDLESALRYDKKAIDVLFVYEGRETHGEIILFLR